MDRPLSAPPGWGNPPDNDAARLALKYFRALPHTLGELARSRKTLGDTWMDWEDRLTRILYGTLREDGRRRYEIVYIEMPKKTGKSHWAAGAAGHGLLVDREFGAQVFSAAYNQKQAKVVWRIFKDMVQLAPWLRKRLEVRDYVNTISCPALSATFQPLTKQSLGQHGFNPHLAIFDELHTQQRRDQYDAVKESMGARRQPLLLSITNAGSDRESLCYEIRKYAMQVNDGVIEDPNFLGLIFGAEEDDDWTDPEVWKRANPGIGVTVRLEKIEQGCREAQQLPSAQNSFRRWQLSQWTRTAERWIDMALWDRARREYAEEDLIGRTCYGGLDLGAVEDLTAWLKAFPDPDNPELVRLVCHAWCAESRLKDASNPYAEQYAAWARAGWLHVCEGAVIDYADVRTQILEDLERYELVDMGVDTQFQGHQLMVELAEDHGITVAGMRTTYSQMTAPCDEFERRLMMDPPKIVHDGNPVLAWAVSNTALRNPDPDRKRPVRDTKEAKIDPVVAALMALDRSMRHEDEGGSVYDHRGVRVLGADESDEETETVEA